MIIICDITFYSWDNHQGGSGKYIRTELYLEIDDDVKASQFWELTHIKIKEYLKKIRPFDQSIYLKDQKEYIITSARIV